MPRTKQERIQSVQSKKPESGKFMTYWMTRDRSASGLSDLVDIWLVRPSRRSQDGLVFWTCDTDVIETGNGPQKVKYAVWTREHCLKEAKVYPDDDLMLICNGDGTEEKKELHS